MPELMSFKKDIEPCQKQREIKNLTVSTKLPKKKIVSKLPANIKFTKVIK